MCTKLYFVSYNPLCSTKNGADAINKYGLHKFIDSSNRREPDFEGYMQGVSSLCRAGKFAPKLKVGDRIIYKTNKFNVQGVNNKVQYITAILEVDKVFNTHREASEWYAKNRHKIPSNCMSKDNPPIKSELCGGGCYLEKVYKERSEEYPQYNICKAIFLELDYPPIVADNELINIFGKVPCLENPPEISIEEYNRLVYT